MKKSRSENAPLFCKIEDGKIIDGNVFTWAENLPDNQRRFVIFYVFQFFNSGKYNATDAARKAGYKDSKTLKAQAQHLIENEKVYREIRNIQSQVADKYTKVDLKNEIMRIIERKKERAQFNPIDIYDVEETVTDEGVRYVRGDVKPKSELTEKQKRMIMGVKFEGQRGIVNYVTPDITKEENDLINIYSKLFDKQEETGNEFDVETTAEIIGEKMQVKTKVIRANKETADMSELASIRAATREEED
jgi:hypothetical protein